MRVRLVMAMTMVMAITLMTAFGARAAETFPERKVAEAGTFVIEYSAGDEAYATALQSQLPLDLSHEPAPDLRPVELTVADLRAHREQVLKLVAARLALPRPTPKMAETFDAFVGIFVALQTLDPLQAATHFTLWRKPELQARLEAGQEIGGFTRLSDGGIQFTAAAPFEFHEGEPPEAMIERMRAQWSRITWPVKIGEMPGASPAQEIQERLAGLRANVAQLSALRTGEIQRLALMTVLHETVESTLVSSYIRSADRRWFCEGVANHVAHEVIADLAGGDAARSYYDVDSEVRRFAALRERVDLAHWPVLENAGNASVPADVETASYAFATQAVASAFAAKGLLESVLTEVRKTPIERADMNTVYAAYRERTGRDLREFLKP